MAPKFLRRIKKKIQNFFTKRKTYNELDEENFDYIETVRVESPEVLNLTLASATEVTFEADFSFFDNYENGCWDDNFENAAIDNETDDAIVASTSTETTKTHYVQEWYKTWRRFDTYEIADEESLMMTKNIIRCSSI